MKKLHLPIKTMLAALAFIFLTFFNIAISHAQTKSNPADNFWIEIEPMPDYAVNSLIEDNHGNLVASMDNRFIESEGMFISRDEGVTWNSIGLDGITAYSLYQHFDGKLFAGTGHFYSLYVLEEGSTEWVGIQTPGNDNTISIMCSEDTTLFIGSWTGIDKTKDLDNYTWQHVYDLGTGTTSVEDLIDLGNGVLLAGVMDHMGLGEGGILRSVDNGDTWEFVELDNDGMMTFAKNSKNEIFAGSYLEKHPFYKSKDLGITWEELQLPFYYACVQTLEIDTNDVLYIVDHCEYAVSQGVFRSSDNGNTFESIASGMIDNRVQHLCLTREGYLYAYSHWEYNKIYRSRESVYSEFAIELAAEPAGTGIVNGAGKYLFGEHAQLEAVPESGYKFDYWTNQDGDTISEEATYRHLVTRDCKITGHFSEVTDVDELDADIISIQPNPFDGEIRIDGIKGEAAISICNVTGTVVCRQSVSDGAKIDLSHLSAGIYYLSIEINGEMIMRKIVKR